MAAQLPTEDIDDEIDEHFPRDTQADAQLDAVLAAARVLAAIGAASLAEIEDVVTLPQLRALVILNRRGPSDLAALTQSLGVHPSSATRICDRLVGAGLLSRREQLRDRHNIILELTDAGHRLVATVMGRRRAAIGTVLQRMPPKARDRLTDSLLAFARAGAEAEAAGVWAMGWTTWDE